MKILTFLITLCAINLSNLACDRNYYIVSDFDDTIKTYNTHDTVPFAATIIFGRQINAGFDVLYQAMVEENSWNCLQEDLFTVLTASPKALKGAIKSLMGKFDFPQYSLIAKPLLKDTLKYKTDAVLEIMNEIDNVPFILIGDDTSQDFAAYSNVKDSTENRVLETYIHNVENKNIAKGQIHYLTAFDIAYNEYLNERLSQNAVRNVARKILKAEDRFIIPPYSVYCPITLAPIFDQDFEIEELGNAINERISNICQKRTLSSKNIY